MIIRNALKITSAIAIALSVLPATALPLTVAHAEPAMPGPAIISDESDVVVMETLPVVAGLTIYLDAVSAPEDVLSRSGLTSDQLGAIYDKDTYLSLYPDVAAAYGDDDELVLEHFLTHGMLEGRIASPTFNVDSYFLQYPDLRIVLGLDIAQYYRHYVTCGYAEGRSPSGYSDPSAMGEAAIRGRSKASVAQMAAAFRASGHAFPMATYARYGASTIEDFCTILLEEATVEGVRAEVVFAQCMHETGWLQFHGDVSGSQCNFAGLGVYGGSTGAVFNDWGADSVRKGLRAEIQHLMAYCTTEKLANECVDPRFSLITRGCAPTVYDLGGKWAVPGDNYGNAIMGIVTDVLSR